MPKQVPTYIILCHLIFTILPAFSQIGHLRFNYFGTREGLSDKQVNHVVQGGDGFLWIGTSNGLNRFDGKQFKVYKPQPNDPHTVPGENFVPLYSMPNGDVWTSSVKGIVIYKAQQKRFERLLHNPADKSSAPSQPLWMMQDSKKRYWLGSYQGWYLFNPKTKTFSHYQYHQLEKDYTIGIRGVHTEAMLEANDGTFWVVSNYGLYHFDAESNKVQRYLFENGKPTKEVANLFTSGHLDKQTGNLWMGTWAGGLVCFNIHTRQFTQYFFSDNKTMLSNHNIITDLLPKSANEYWIASPDSGFGIFNTQTHRFNFYKAETSQAGSIPGNNVLYLAKDWQDNLWISTGVGLYSLNSRTQVMKWHRYPKLRPTDPYHFTMAFIKDTAAKKLYMGIDIDEGIYIYDFINSQYEKIIWKECINNKNIPFNTVHMLQDSRKWIWIAGYTGIYRYLADKKEIVKENTLSALMNEHTHGTRMVEDSKGYLWIISRWNGCYRYHPVTKSLDHFSVHPTGPVVLRSNRIADIKEHSPGVMLIIGGEPGLYLLDLNEKKTKDIVSKDQVKDLAAFQEGVKAADGSYWIGTANFGLLKLQPSGDTFVTKRYFTDDNHPALKIHRLALDNKGLLWIGSEKGLIVMNTHTGKERYFNSLDGLIEDEIWQRIYAAPDGNIYVGRESGYIEINPEKLLKREPAPPIYFTSVKVAGKEWVDSLKQDDAKRKIELNFNQNMLDISFAALNFSNPQEIRYTYRIEGLENAWIPIGNQSQINLVGIPPGSYKLLVKAESTDGSWLSRPAVLAIVIHPPFYKTWWFITIAVIVLTLMILAIHLYRIKQMREKEQLKASLQQELARVEMKALRAQMNPHFIFNCLNSINGYIAKNEQKEASHYLARFAKLIRLILENAQHEFISLESEITTLSLYLEIEAVRFDKKFTYDLKVDESLMPDRLLIPSMVIQPFVENAIWHGLMHQQKPGMLVLSFQPLDDNMLKVVIEDNGVGRDKAASLNSKNELKNKSYGMRITGERIRLLNEIQASDASQQIEDLFDANGIPAGTRVTLQLPIKTKSPEI